MPVKELGPKDWLTKMERRFYTDYNTTSSFDIDYNTTSSFDTDYNTTSSFDIFTTSFDLSDI